MEHTVTILIAAAFLMLIAAAGLDIARRQYARKRGDSRIGRALRRSITESEEFQRRDDLVVEWQ